MSDKTGMHTADGTVTRTHTVLGVLAGTAFALGILGVAWWQDWLRLFVGWAAVKIGAKIGAVTVAGCVAFTAWWSKRHNRRNAHQQENPAPEPEQHS